MESFAISLLQKELRGTFHSDLTQNEDSGFSVGLENDNWFLWRICFQGPVDTPFEGGIFVAMLRFPGDYPNNPPEMRFSTEMWHPNSTPRQSFQTDECAFPSCTRQARTNSTSKSPQTSGGDPYWAWSPFYCLLCPC